MCGNTPNSPQKEPRRPSDKTISMESPHLGQRTALPRQGAHITTNGMRLRMWHANGKGACLALQSGVALITRKKATR